VSIVVDGVIYEIQPDEVEVRAEAHSGLVVTSEGPYLAALKTDLTPELAREGLAREFVRRVQELRKQAALDIADRIHLFAAASPALAAAIRDHRESIMGETLAVDLTLETPPAGAITVETGFDGEPVKIGLKKAGNL
jgi:isoleucyl-tRNA synthetase